LVLNGLKELSINGCSEAVANTVLRYISSSSLATLAINEMRGPSPTPIPPASVLSPDYFPNIQVLRVRDSHLSYVRALMDVAVNDPTAKSTKLLRLEVDETAVSPALGSDELEEEEDRKWLEENCSVEWCVKDEGAGVSSRARAFSKRRRFSWSQLG